MRFAVVLFAVFAAFVVGCNGSSVPPPQPPDQEATPEPESEIIQQSPVEIIQGTEVPEESFQ